jgi:hypothetical protein
LDVFVNLLINSKIDPKQAWLLGLLLFFLPIFFFAHWAVKRGTPITLRPIAGYAALKGMLARAAEAGQPVHLSLGISGIGDEFTADTSAALSVLEYLADRGAISASPPIVTVANPTVLPVAQDVMRRAYRRRGYPEEYDATRARWVASDPNLYLTPGVNDAFGYAVGVMRLLKQQKLTANVMIGRFGSEFLLMGEAGAQRNLTQIGGTSAPEVLPFMNSTMTHPLIGEEIYAGGAYLLDKPAHLSSLLAQDLLRWFITGGILVAVLLRTLGLV